MSLKHPVILTFNLRRSVYQNYGLGFFKGLMKYGIPSNLHLMPIITNLEDNIQKRSKKLAQDIQNLQKKLQAEKVHLVSYSSSGIDSRFAMAKLGLQSSILTLTTIGTPHKGSKLAKLGENNLVSKRAIEGCAKLSGIGVRAFYELGSERMSFFNNEINHNDKEIYSSIGGQRLPIYMTQALRENGETLRLKTTPNFVYENDGVFGHDEVSWGKHLINFQADHSQLIGITPSQTIGNILTLVTENLQQSEAHTLAATRQK